MLNNDHDIVEALLRRDEQITREFFYRTCYPLFKSVYDNYHTDCASCMEFINEIYILVLSPDHTTGKCKLDGFCYQSTLFTWLKTVCLFHCYKKFEAKKRITKMPIVENFDDEGVRFDAQHGSIDLDESSLHGCDAETILRLMPNRRYSALIRLRYLENHTNEETAQILGMNLNTFYNKHKLAKEQFTRILKMEESYNG